MQKYRHQRYRYFSRYDQGIKLDKEGWFSVTPERIAIHHARRVAAAFPPLPQSVITVVDAFCGCGGNAIQFALAGFHVIAIELNPKRLAMAKHNAVLYQCQDNIEFIRGNCFEVIPKIQQKIDVIFLSPPWGGPEYLKNGCTYSLNSLKPVGGLELIRRLAVYTRNLILFIPKNTSVQELMDLRTVFPAIDPGNETSNIAMELEMNYLNGREKALTVYFDQLAHTPCPQ